MVKGREQEVEPSGHLTCYEDVFAGVTLARSGAGLFQALRFLVEEDLARGSLLEVLQPYGGTSRPISLIYPSGRHLPQRVRVFGDFYWPS